MLLSLPTYTCVCVQRETSEIYVHFNLLTFNRKQIYVSPGSWQKLSKSATKLGFTLALVFGIVSPIIFPTAIGK